MIAAVKDNNFITIQGWMRTKLNLKGNELLIYALIYGFSQDGNAKFNGSRKYIADWCGCSLDTVDRSLGSLVGKGLIAKYPHTDETGRRLVDYAVRMTAISATPSTPTATATATAQDPEADTTNANTEQSQQPKKPRKTNSFNNIIDSYTDDATTKDLLGAWLQNRKAKRAAMTDRAIQGNLDRLDKCAQDSHMSVHAYLDEIVCRGWSAFYPIESYKRSSCPQKPQRQPQWTPTEEERRQQEADDEYFLKHCVF